jgi:hypothetical protein
MGQQAVRRDRCGAFDQQACARLGRAGGQFSAVGLSDLPGLGAGPFQRGAAKERLGARQGGQVGCRLGAPMSRSG